MHLIHRAVRGAFWAVAENWGRQATSFVVFMVLARLLSPSEIGLFAIVMVVFQFMQVFIDDGIGEAVVQRPVLEPQHLDSAFWFNLGMAVVVSGLGVVTAGPVAALFGEPDLQPLVAAMSLALPLNALAGVHLAILKRRLDFRTLAIRSVAGIVIAGIVGVTMAFAGYGVWSLVAQQVIEKTIGLIVVWSKGGWFPRLRWSSQHARDMVPYGLNIIASRLLIFGYRQMDRFLIGLFLGPAILGIYTLALRIMDTCSTVLVQAATGISLSTFSRLQHDKTQLREAFYSVSQFTALVAFPAFIGLAVVAEDLIVVLFGSRWHDSGEILQILSVTGIPYLIASFTSIIMRATGRPALFVGVLAFGMVINMGLVVLLVPYGLNNVVLGLTLREFAFLPIHLRIARNLLDADIVAYMRGYLPALASTLVMAFATLGTKFLLPEHVNIMFSVVFSIAVGIAAYGLMVMLTSRDMIMRAMTLIREARAPLPGE